MIVVDAHCHISQDSRKSQTASQLIENMDTQGVSMSVIVPVEEHLAVYNEEGNAFIWEQVQKFPSRLIGFGVANPWYGKAGVNLLERYLGMGFRGIKFHPAIQGFQLNEPIIFPFAELAIRHNAPMFFHTGTPVSAIPFQLYELATRYPEGRFIMGHSGYSDYWNDVPFIAARTKNIWFDTSVCLTSRHTDIVNAAGCETPDFFIGQSPFRFGL